MNCFFTFADPGALYDAVRGLKVAMVSLLRQHMENPENMESPDDFKSETDCLVPLYFSNVFSIWIPTALKVSDRRAAIELESEILARVSRSASVFWSGLMTRLIR